VHGVEAEAGFLSDGAERRASVAQRDLRFAGGERPTDRLPAENLVVPLPRQFIVLGDQGVVFPVLMLDIEPVLQRVSSMNGPRDHAPFVLHHLKRFLPVLDDVDVVLGVLAQPLNRIRAAAESDSAAAESDSRCSSIPRAVPRCAASLILSSPVSFSMRRLSSVPMMALLLCNTGKRSIHAGFCVLVPRGWSPCTPRR
jgi:hypothetical protein